MSVTRPSSPGATRLCPHCRAVILESASTCPACKRYLRYDPASAARSTPTFSPLRVEANIRHPDSGGAWEYSVLITIRGDGGAEIARQVIGVGALRAGEERSFTLAVDVFARDGEDFDTS